MEQAFIHHPPLGLLAHGAGCESHRHVDFPFAATIFISQRGRVPADMPHSGIRASLPCSFFLGMSVVLADFEQSPCPGSLDGKGGRYRSVQSLSSSLAWAALCKVCVGFRCVAGGVIDRR